MFLNALIVKMMLEPGVYLHCFPNYSQGKRAIWDSIHSTDDGDSLGYLDHFPQELIASKNSSEMMIKLKTGSIYCVMGLDGKNSQRARGMNPRFVILSEYAFMDPESWYTLEPRITQNNGTAVFLSTPNGQNHFYSLYNYAKSNPKEYFSSFLTIEDTKTVAPSHIENLRREGVPEDFIQQEYYCSFTRGAEGSYYGKQIQKARDEGRITRLSVNNSLPCYTAWDIGVGDSTSIWIFQCLDNGKINFVHYYENQGEQAEFYCRYLDHWKRKHDIMWGRHYVPHDMSHTEWTGGDRVEAMRKLGFNVDVLPREPKIDEGINRVRGMLPFCSFDQIQCSHGIKCLDFYRKKYNDILKVYNDQPCHDKWSHGCFPADTRISTISGEKPIQDISIGDFVKTPNGYKRVSYLHKYKADKLVSITSSSGRTLKCTPNHKIFTSNSLVYADTLCYTDRLIEESAQGFEVCQKYIGCHGEKIGLGFRETFLSMNLKQESSLTDTFTHGMASISSQEEHEDFIAKFGNIIMGIYQRAITFITSMVIPKTMTFQICNVSAHQNIQSLDVRQIHGWEAKQIRDNCAKTMNEPKNGMQVKKERNGIQNMERNVGKIEFGINLHAKYAVKSPQHLIQQLPNYVRAFVGLKRGIIHVLTTLIDRAKFAIKNSLSTNIKNREHVQDNAVMYLEKEIDVYDFEVEEDHCYYANGILVSNSDAMRYACQGIKFYGTSANTMTPERLRDIQSRAGYGPKNNRPPNQPPQMPIRGF